MIPRFTKGMRLLSASAFRDLLNQIVDAVNGLLEAQDNYSQIFDSEDGVDTTWYRVSASEVLVTDRKWSYTLTPQRLKESIMLGAYSVMEDDPDGTALLLAVNVAEDRNTEGSTLQGNDVNFSNAVFGTTAGTLAPKLKPIGANHLVQIKGFFNTGAGTEEDPFVQHAMFDAANIVLEPCITE